MNRSVTYGSAEMALCLSNEQHRQSEVLMKLSSNVEKTVWHQIDSLTTDYFQQNTAK